MLYIKEAKFRFLYIFFCFVFTWICSYFFCNQFIYIFILPLKQVYSKINPNALFHLIFTELTEIFFVQIKISLFITFFFFFPFILYQIFLFVKPGLYNFEKKIFILFSFFSFFLSSASIFFTYFFFLPYTCHFFLSFENINGFHLYLEAKMDNYLSFLFLLHFTSFFFFQFPLLFFFFFQLGLFNLNIFIEKRKIFYLFFLFLSILITPPDLFSQLFFFILFFFFYELNLFILLFFYEKHQYLLHHSNLLLK